MLGIVESTDNDTLDINELDTVLLYSLIQWFNECNDRTQHLVEILIKKRGVSLRLLDWSITVYSRKNHIIIGGEMPRDLYTDYQRHLTAFNKNRFDPFARRKRINMLVTNGLEKYLLLTTVAQLNFIKWYISIDVHAFILSNKDKIETHMKNSTSIEKRTPGGVQSYCCDMNMQF
jgi:hypothetical protein